MKAYIIALGLAMTTVAAAQSPMPRTIQLIGPDNQIVGTATISGNRTYFRDAKGELTGSSTINADGTVTTYDASGHIISNITGITTPDGKVMVIRDADGQITGTATKNKDGTITTRDVNGKIIGSNMMR